MLIHTLGRNIVLQKSVPAYVYLNAISGKIQNWPCNNVYLILLGKSVSIWIYKNSNSNTLQKFFSTTHVCISFFKCWSRHFIIADFLSSMFHITKRLFLIRVGMFIFKEKMFLLHRIFLYGYQMNCFQLQMTFICSDLSYLVPCNILKNGERVKF